MNIEWIASSCVLILLVVLIRLVFRKKISLRVRYCLWAVVALRLLVPVSFSGTSWSVLNLLPEYNDVEAGLPGGVQESYGAGERSGGVQQAGEGEKPSGVQEQYGKGKGTGAPEEGESGDKEILWEVSAENGADESSSEDTSAENTGTEVTGENGGSVDEGGIPAGLIAEQSFETELDGWGEVTFTAFEPLEYLSENPDYGQTMFGDVRFMLLSDERVLYTLPGETEDNILSGFTQFREVLSVSFKDYNEDGRTDILLLLEYMGSGGESLRKVRAYTQEEGEKEFRIDKLLSEYLGNYTESMSRVYEGIDYYSKSYSICTDISAWEVERFARLVRKQILEGDYESLAEECIYPLMVNGVSYESKEALLAASLLQNPGQPFLDAVREEAGEQMFHNWQGIMLGNGEVWFAEVLGEDLSSGGLKIIAFNNIALAR